MSAFSIDGPDHVNVALRNALHDTAHVTSHPVAAAPKAALEAQLSPLAQVTSTLQELQGSDPAKYRQIARQIASSLQSDAKTAQAEGETSTANRLNQLAGVFTSAAESGELPNLQDLIALAAF